MNDTAYDRWHLAEPGGEHYPGCEVDGGEPCSCDELEEIAKDEAAEAAIDAWQEDRR